MKEVYEEMKAAVEEGGKFAKRKSEKLDENRKTLMKEQHRKDGTKDGGKKKRKMLMRRICNVKVRQMKRKM